MENNLRYRESKLTLEKTGVGQYTIIGYIEPNVNYIIDGNNLTIVKKDE